MLAMLIWVVGFAISISILALTAGANLQSLHLTICAVISLAIAFSATMEMSKAQAAGQNRSQVAAAIARYMGLLWSWSAVAIAVTYALVLSWVNWLPIFMILMLGAGTCLFVARILDRESVATAPDARIISLVRFVAWSKFGATCLTIGGLLAAGKLGADGFGGQSRWAAMNIMLCTAIGLSLISGYALIIRHEAPDARRLV